MAATGSGLLNIGLHLVIPVVGIAAFIPASGSSSALEVPGGRVWYRAVGEETGATPLLCLHGGPGFTHYYLEPPEAGYQVYNTMNGPSEFTVTGTLKTCDIMDRLPEIQVPTLLVGGRYDECTPGHLAEMHRRIAGSRLEIIEDASHPVLRRTAGHLQRSP